MPHAWTTQVPFSTKIKNAQAAGALAVVIIDSSGECSQDFDCGRLLGSKSNREYLGDIDDQVPCDGCGGRE